jgi:hypothetical protein
MSTLLTKFTAFFGVLTALSAAGCGGNSVEDNCSIFCDKSVSCQTDATDKATCMSICQKQAEDEAYADAIDLQSECYEDATCDDIANGFCDPQDL